MILLRSPASEMVFTPKISNKFPLKQNLLAMNVHKTFEMHSFLPIRHQRIKIRSRTPITFYGVMLNLRRVIMPI